jgi:thiamine pyrophosphate-dependent acetolactate synthase large subunit-like protein
MTRNRILLERRAVVAKLLAERGELLVVSGLGAPTYDCAAVGDHDLNFYLWGAMGSAAMIGLGLATAQPQRPVLVITGDGEMLMGLGALATIGVRKPANLAVVVLDNERYGETGNQPTHTADGVDLAGVAAAAGVARTFRVEDDASLAALLPLVRTGQGPLFAAVKVSDKPDPMVLPPRDGAYLKHRFRTALLGPAALK